MRNFGSACRKLLWIGGVAEASPLLSLAHTLLAVVYQLCKKKYYQNG